MKSVIARPPEPAPEARNFINIKRLLEIVPGTTPGYWAQLRYRGTGPRYYKPSPKLTLYDEAEVREWLENAARTRSDQAAISA